MLKVLRFTILAMLLLIVPAFIYGASVFRNGNLTANYLAHWFLGNYLYMALPHLLVMFSFLTVSSFSDYARKLTIFSLCILNIILLTFQSWVWFIVPAGESGLAWVLYIPVWVIFLALVVAFHHYRKPGLPLTHHSSETPNGAP